MQIRRGGTIAAMVAGLVIGATVVRRHNHPGVPLLPGPARRQALAEAKLRVVLPEVRFRGTPLEKALQELQARSGAAFTIDWDEIEGSNLNVRRDDPVDVSLRNVTLEQAMNAVLGYSSPARLGFTLFDGAIVITPEPDGGQFSYAAVYDLREIEPVAAEIWADQSVVPVSSGVGLFGNLPNPPPTPPRVEMDDQLTILIQDAVAPESWVENGGTGGTVRTFGGRVVAVTTWQNHRQIQFLISRLRNPTR
jgi:hypothetical protein